MEQKREEGTQRFLKGVDKLGQGVGALKRGDWNPLTNYGLITSYWMLQSCKVTDFTVSYLYGENQHRLKSPSQSRLGFNNNDTAYCL